MARLGGLLLELGLVAAGCDLTPSGWDADTQMVDFMRSIDEGATWKLLERFQLPG